VSEGVCVCVCACVVAQSTTQLQSLTRYASSSFQLNPTSHTAAAADAACHDAKLIIVSSTDLE